MDQSQHELCIRPNGSCRSDRDLNVESLNGLANNLWNVFSDVSTWTEKVGVTNNFIDASIQEFL